MRIHGMLHVYDVMTMLLTRGRGALHAIVVCIGLS
jgi:hypothetical protein